MNKLFRYLFLMFILLKVGYSAHAQPQQVQVYRQPGWRYNQRFNNQNQQNPQKRIMMVKINYLRNKLRLDPDQSQRFFPLYQEFQNEMFNVRQLKRQNNLNGAAEGTGQINRELYYENQIVQIRIKFNNAFLKILNPVQVSELYKAEREFNDELVRQLSERRGNQPNYAPGPPPPVPGQ